MTAARVEQRRALNAASELSSANDDDKGGINLPAGGTLGAGGTKAKTPGIMVSASCLALCLDCTHGGMDVDTVRLAWTKTSIGTFGGILWLLYALY